ncbi:UNVERIFIED_CONTAM: hypothetical protein HHA_257420 [Hammondia hammondi]|eukprot:XP_008883242.1 hypothetical protein HHA_257420 [Hammondia hammondi]
MPRENHSEQVDDKRGHARLQAPSAAVGAKRAYREGSGLEAGSTKESLKGDRLERSRDRDTETARQRRSGGDRTSVSQERKTSMFSFEVYEARGRLWQTRADLRVSQESRCRGSVSLGGGALASHHSLSFLPIDSYLLSRWPHASRPFAGPLAFPLATLKCFLSSGPSSSPSSSSPSSSSSTSDTLSSSRASCRGSTNASSVVSLFSSSSLSSSQNSQLSAVLNFTAELLSRLEKPHEHGPVHTNVMLGYVPPPYSPPSSSSPSSSSPSSSSPLSSSSSSPSSSSSSPSSSSSSSPSSSSSSASSSSSSSASSSSSSSPSSSSSSSASSSSSSSVSRSSSSSSHSPSSSSASSSPSSSLVACTLSAPAVSLPRSDSLSSTTNAFDVFSHIEMTEDTVRLEFKHTDHPLYQLLTRVKILTEGRDFPVELLLAFDKAQEGEKAPESANEQERRTVQRKSDALAHEEEDADALWHASDQQLFWLRPRPVRTAPPQRKEEEPPQSSKPTSPLSSCRPPSPSPSAKQPVAFDVASSVEENSKNEGGRETRDEAREPGDSEEKAREEERKTEENAWWEGRALVRDVINCTSAGGGATVVLDRELFTARVVKIKAALTKKKQVEEEENGRPQDQGATETAEGSDSETGDDRGTRRPMGALFLFIRSHGMEAAAAVNAAAAGKSDSPAKEQSSFKAIRESSGQPEARKWSRGVEPATD